MWDKNPPPHRQQGQADMCAEYAYDITTGGGEATFYEEPSYSIWVRISYSLFTKNYLIKQNIQESNELELCDFSSVAE